MITGSEWVTLIGFAVAMIVLSFFSRESALWVTGAVGMVILLRHNISGVTTPSAPTGGLRQ